MKAPSTETVLLCLTLAATWALTHHYALAGDGELYAFQAMARINPALRADVYLASGSQDQYTLFSPLFAWAISAFGLLNAAAALFAICTLAFLAAAWGMARVLWDERIAWLSVVMLTITVVGYGANGVFHSPENYLTARSMAEALVATALTARFLGYDKAGWAIAALSLFIHPLMALPGLLLLSCLAAPWRLSLTGAIAGIVLSLAIEALSSTTAHSWKAFSIMDSQWVEVVRQRSQFLFLNYWQASDWQMHARTLLCLLLCTLSSSDARERRLCIAAALVGVTGLIIALIASNFGPAPILLQGQAWRWFWVTSFVSVLVILPTAMRLWKETGCGSVCAILLVASWTFSPINGTLLVAAALGLWCLRNHVRPPTQNLLRMLAFLLIGIIVTWTLANIWSVCSSPLGTKTAEPALIERLRSVYALPIAALAVYGLLWKWVRTPHSARVTAAVALLTFTVGAIAMKGSFSRPSTVGTADEYRAFADWRDAVPPTSNVLLVPAGNSAAFVWFSLQRPSYISVNQAAGVVFSAETSQEIRRRSQVLLPIMDPDWQLLSRNSLVHQGKKTDDQTRPLTVERLVAICVDPRLGFVIAKPFLGFGARTHSQIGQWKDWNLYDCRQVRASDSTA